MEAIQTKKTEKMSLLIVDDEQSICSWLGRRICEIGFRFRSILEENDPFLALELIRNEEIHIVLSDIRMPGMDGIELLKQIKQVQPHIQVVLISAWEDFNLAQEAMLYNASGYLLKPINDRELMEALRQALARQTPMPYGQSVGDASAKLNIIQQVRFYINENFASDICLKDLADRFFISQQHLSSSFRRHTGRTFTEYLNEVRLFHVRKLLDTTDLPIKVVAQRCGYNDYSYFCRVFKLSSGQTALAFRQRLSVN